MKGLVTDSNAGVASKITVIDEDNKTVHGVYNSQPGSGKYMMVLNPNINYRVIVEADDKVVHTENLSYTIQDCLEIVNLNIELDSK